MPGTQDKLPFPGWKPSSSNLVSTSTGWEEHCQANSGAQYILGIYVYYDHLSKLKNREEFEGGQGGRGDNFSGWPEYIPLGKSFNSNIFWSLYTYSKLATQNDYLETKTVRKRICDFPEMPAHDLVFQIFSRRMTIANKWDRSPANLKINSLFQYQVNLLWGHVIQRK